MIGKNNAGNEDGWNFRKGQLKWNNYLLGCYICDRNVTRLVSEFDIPSFFLNRYLA